MRLQITTEYAIRVMLFMAQQDGKVTTVEAAAKQTGITYSYFNKVAWKMKMAGFLESVQGSVRGYRIEKNARDVTLYHIVKVMEGDIRINRCLEDDGFCSRNATLICPIRKTFEDIQDQIVHTLKSVKISDLCDEKRLNLSREIDLGGSTYV